MDSRVDTGSGHDGFAGMEQSRSMEVPAGDAPAIALRYSFGASLYQRLMAHARRFRLTGVADEAGWESAIRRAAELYIPTGPFSWFEFAIGEGDTIDALRRALEDRAGRFCAELAELLTAVCDDYRERLWGADRALLERSCAELHAILAPYKEVLLGRLASQFEFGLSAEAISVLLVPVCHEPLGAYSHPLVVDVSRFGGLDLVEVTLHEMTHVLAERNRANAEGGIAVIRRTCQRLGRSERFWVEIFHLLVFHAVGELVRGVYDPAYRTQASARGVYTKLGRLLGTTLSEEGIRAIWDRRLSGELGLEEVIEQLDRHLRAGAVGRAT